MSAVLEKEAVPKAASLAELRRPLAPEQSMPVVRMGFGDLQGFELMQRAAKALAASTLVPPQFQGNLPNCIIALEMANRIGASPLMVVQNLFVVHGRPGWSAKFLIASFNQCGRFTALRYEWQGKEGEELWGCRAWATEKATGEKIVGPLITIALARKEGWIEKQGSKWKTIPELMLTYRAAAWLVNTHAPEISMGLNTQDEIGDTFDAAQGEDGQFKVTQDDLRRVDTETGEVIEQTAVGAAQQTGGEPTGATGDNAPTVDYEKLLTRIKEAKDIDMIDADAALIGQVEGADRQNTLAKNYKIRRAELQEGRAKK